MSVNPTNPRLELRGLEPTDDVAIHGDVPWTRAELAQQAKHIGRWLDEHGVGPEGVVAVIMHNRPSTVCALAHLVSTGRTLIVCNSMLPTGAMFTDVSRLGAEAVLGSEGDFDGEIGDAVKQLGLPVGAIPEQPGSPTLEVVAGTTEGAEVEADSSVAIWMLSSGTTGVAKRIPVTYRALRSAFAASEDHYIGARGASVTPRRGRGVTVVAVPCVNVSGLWGILTVLVGGGALVLLEKFDAHAWADAVSRYRPRSANLPPTALRMILDSDVPRDSLTSLRAVWSGSAPLSPEVARRFREEFGVPVLTSYGATEFTGGIAGWSMALWREWGERKLGSVGRPYPSTQIRIVDENDEQVPANTTGLITIQSPQANVGEPGDFLKTNDLGRVDIDGFLWVEGRADDVITRGGFKVAPGDVEDALLQHPHVVDAAVIAEPDERLGQVPVAAVVTSADVAEADLKSWVRGRLAPYSVPVRIRAVDAIPRNPGMKVMRRDLAVMLKDA